MEKRRFIDKIQINAVASPTQDVVARANNELNGTF